MTQWYFNKSQLTCWNDRIRLKYNWNALLITNIRHVGAEMQNSWIMKWRKRNKISRKWARIPNLFRTQYQFTIIHVVECPKKHLYEFIFIWTINLELTEFSFWIWLAVLLVSLLVESLTRKKIYVDMWNFV